MFESLLSVDREQVLAACRVIQATGRASVATVQRRLRISYTESARIIDILEESGVVGPPAGSVGRTIFADKLDEALNGERNT